MRFAQEFSPEETREMRVTVIWKGIKDRTLISTNQRIGPLHWERKSQQDEIRSDLVIPDALHLQDQLPEFVHKLTKPLYDAFDFFKMPESTMQNQLDEMMARVR
ncbi:MAG: hypothetical protein O2904_01800 [bacterium]|nr:hypothetical protein [bacterium]